MLTLTRRVDESIVIQSGDDVITLRVKNIRGNQVKIGIDAPKHFGVLRSELLSTNIPKSEVVNEVAIG